MQLNKDDNIQNGKIRQIRKTDNEHKRSGLRLLKLHYKCKLNKDERNSKLNEAITDKHTGKMIIGNFHQTNVCFI